MHSAVKNLWREKPGRGAVFCLICMRFLRITVRLCVYGRYNDRKKYSNEKEGEKEMLPNLFLSKNMIIFRWWELEMEELWRHWAMKFSFAPKVFFLFVFFFFSAGFHHAECIMLTNQGGPAGVKASHNNNTNIRTCLLF